jgi:multidrug efflux pump subunit AcrA (membrane-fusion protein)
LNSALLKKQGAEKLVQLQRERVKRIEKVSLSQIVPGQHLDDARVLLTDAETQLGIATAAVQLWRKALEEADRPGDRESTSFSQPLLAPADGEVTEVAARPGMAIEAGGLVARAVDFRRVRSRLDMPPELIATGPPPRVWLTALSSDSSTPGGFTSPSDPAEPAARIPAVLVGPAPSVDVVSQLAGYWYVTEPDRSEGTAEEPGPGSGPADGAVWRPGLLVKALISPAGAPAMHAVSVPAEALLFHQGRTLLYVRQRPGAYERREVRLLGREGNVWIVALRQGTGLAGLSPGEIIVSRGAQMLLSEEFRGDVEAD